MNHPDTVLLERWLAHRDPEAMAAIVRRHAAMVFATCRRATGNAADAEDVAQECFLKLAAVGQGGSCLAALLHTMATRLSLNAIRGNARRRAREAAYAGAMDVAVEPAWDGVQPLIDEAIAALAEERRVPLVRHYLEGETHAQIARDLGVTRAAVSQRVAKGVGEVRENLHRRGVAVSGVALGSMLVAAGTEALPVGLVASLGRVAVSGAGQGAAHGTLAAKIAEAGW